MSIATGSPGLLESAAALDFSRTVDQKLIHRRNATEAFLADVRPVDARSYVAAALLPRVHPHYTSHTRPAGGPPDPLLLLECCRQAETYAAHSFFGVETDACFVLRNWSVEMFPDALQDAPTGCRELLMTAVTASAGPAGARARGLFHDIDLYLAGALVARVRMEVGYLARDLYTVIRSRGRTSPLPLSDGPLPARAGRPADPAHVGRINAADALLLDVRAARDAVTATLRIAADNRSFFDHPHDHVPGMVLTEAARQLAAVAAHTWDGIPPHVSAVAAARSSFAAYTELDETVSMTATPAQDGAGPAAADGGPAGRRAVEVVFRQRDAQTARMSVLMALDPRAALDSRAPFGGGGSSG